MVGSVISLIPERGPLVGGSCMVDLWGSLILRDPLPFSLVSLDTSYQHCHEEAGKSLGIRLGYVLEDGVTMTVVHQQAGYLAVCIQGAYTSHPYILH